MVVPGGVWDQPAGMWQAQQRAGRVWYILDQEAQATKEYPLDQRLKADDLKELIGDPNKPGDEGLRGIRKRILAENQRGR